MPLQILFNLLFNLEPSPTSFPGSFLFLNKSTSRKRGKPGNEVEGGLVNHDDENADNVM